MKHKPVTAEELLEMVWEYQRRAKNSYPEYHQLEDANEIVAACELYLTRMKEDERRKSS